MHKKILIPIVFALILVFLFISLKQIGGNTISRVIESNFQSQMAEENMDEPFTLSIEFLRQGEYPGSDLVIEETLSPGSNYQRFIASYKSEGLKIFGLLTIPNEDAPEEGYPAIVFNHGFIPPTEHRTTEKYIAYTDAFSRNGYVLFRSDYRGHDKSEGAPTGAYGSNGYTIDVLNAFSSVKKLDEVNPEKIGMWGHSMGGFITLRSMVVNPEIKVGVIWAGVVVSYEDLFTRWRSNGPTPSDTNSENTRSRRRSIFDVFGEPSENRAFWDSLSANSFLKDISGPIQLHHGTGDTTVPFEFSEILEKQLTDVGGEIELFLYEGDNHNINANFNIAANRSVEYFDKYLK